MDEDYLIEVAAAYVRGHLGVDGSDDEMMQRGFDEGLKMYRFKRSELPRVTKCIGLLKGLAPQTLLDVGTGRGVFLWTMLTDIPYVTANCIDILDHRVELINTVKRGGFSRVEAQLTGASSLSYEDGHFDVVTALEVLEHMESPLAAVKELIRVASQYILVSVPSKPDNNPEHIQLFSADDLENLLLQGGAKSVQLHHVLNHRIALGKL